MIEELYNKAIKEADKEILETSHLCHIFIMPPSNFNPLVNEVDFKEAEVHIGFFNRESKKIFSYKILDKELELIPEQEIFQKQEEDVDEASFEGIIPIEKVLEILRKEIKEKYSDTVSFKSMFVLQKLKDLGLVWNVTVLRRDFKTVNLKIDAKSGEIKTSTCASIIDMNKSK